MSFRKIFWLLFILFTLPFSRAHAQADIDPDIAQILGYLESNLQESSNFEELIDRLTQYKAHPLNINKASDADLKELWVLSPIQMAALQTHILANGPLIDLLELQSVDHFDSQTIRLLLPFIQLGFENPFAGKGLASVFSGKHDILLRYEQDLQKAEGYLTGDSSQNRFLGGPQHLLVRYRYAYGKHLSWAFQAEKDAGESFFTRQPFGFDFVSGHLEFKQVGFFKKVEVGDYNLQVGEGLSLWSGLGFGKSSLLSSIAKQEIGLKAYSSVNEGFFFRGLATQLEVKGFHIIPFYSNRNLDASLQDSVGITSINLSGLHRTASEMAYKQTLNQQVYGTALKYKFHRISIGITGYHTQFNKAFQGGQELYNQFKFSGKSLNNYSVNYHFSVANTYYFGEFAHGSGGKPAYLAGLLSSLSSTVTLGLLYRNYPASYHSFYNAALAESSTSINERGFYSGLGVKFHPKWEWSFYTDVFSFPWLSFGVNAPANGFELLSQLSYKPNKISQLQLFYQRTEKGQNSTEPDAAMAYIKPHVQQKYRIDFRYPLSRNFSMHHRVEMTRVGQEQGYVLLHDLVYQPLQSKLSGNIRFAVFNVSDYDARIYAFQNDVLYSYSIEAYQNRGFQVYVNTRYTLQKGLDVWLRYETKRYANLSSVGSGLTAIKGNHQSEFKIQVRYQF
ncbi:MAG: hypothetical protein ACKOWL_02185 [Sphingobacteriaceae bacterium]